MMAESAAKFKLFDEHPELCYGMTSRADGSMHSDDRASTKNREAFFRSSCVRPENVYYAHLVHGNHIVRVSHKDKERETHHTDGLITDEVGLGLSITVADCLPIYAYDTRKRVVGIAHAGWRGIVRGVVPELLLAMRHMYGTEFDDLVIGIGPGIGGCHFEVKEDVAARFRGFFSAVRDEAGKVYVDLVQAVWDQLVANGVPAWHIERSNVCTVCKKDTFFSCRGDGERFGTQAAWIALQ